MSRLSVPTSTAELEDDAPLSEERLRSSSVGTLETQRKSKVSFGGDIPMTSISCVHEYQDDNADEEPEKPEKKTKGILRKHDPNSNLKRYPSICSMTKFTSVKRPGFGLLHFVTLKIIFYDIVISVGDVVSDFMQGASLILTPGNEIYGWVTIAINWMPGLIAALHLISMYRGDLGVKKTFTYAALLILLYPIVPVIAFAMLLWYNPHESDDQEKVKKFREAEYRAMISHAISGGVESPIQFVLQIWLILNGIRPTPWHEYGSITITDWKGNTIALPTAASISIMFSIFSILKAVIEFNILRVHCQDITNWSRSLDFGVFLCDHLPFLTTATFFRIMSIAFLLTFLHNFGFIPIFVYMLLNLFYGYNKFDPSTIPLWLVSLISIFFPVCFTTANVSERKRGEMIEVQYRTFFLQTLFSIIVYLPSLIGCCIVINFIDDYRYDSDIILDNTEFNVFALVIAAMGLISLIMAYTPSTNGCRQSIRNAFRRTNSKEPTIVSDEIDGLYGEVDDDSISFIRARTEALFPLGKICNMLLNLIMVGILFAPVFLPNLILAFAKEPRAHLYHKANESYTKAIECVLLNGVHQEVHATALRTYYPKMTLKQSSITVHIGRLEWHESLTDYDLQNASAIIIVDSGKYRPSAPINIKTRPNLPMPIVLVQNEDYMFFLGDRNKQRLLLSLTFSGSVPDSQWECDVKATASGTCFEPQINRTSRIINGVQYRKKECMWGMRPCFGIFNDLEKMYKCEGPQLKPICARDEPVDFKGQPERLNGTSKFVLEITPPSCVPLRYVEPYECNIWSEWLKWRKVQYIDKDYRGHVLIQRSRFCVMPEFNEKKHCVFRDR